MGGGSPIDAAKAMWAFYEYPDVTFEAFFLLTPLNALMNLFHNKDHAVK